MRSPVVECLRCGLPRRIPAVAAHVASAGQCPRCDYVGWAASERLSDEERGALREVPLELRRRGRPGRPVAVS